MIAPGPLNSICDVSGIAVGNAENLDLTTGATVILPDRACPVAVDHRGGGIGSRATAGLAPGSTVTEVDAITLSGGSSYGLDAAGGVMHALRGRGRGLAIAGEVVPIVPGSIIFDLLCGGPKSWEGSPWWALGQKALAAASTEFALGNAGAGLGATAGFLKGGLGTASFRADGFTVGALAVANPVGLVVIPGTDSFWAWRLEQNGELGGQAVPGRTVEMWEGPPEGPALANTTLAVVATDLALTRDQLIRIAIMAQDGTARAIRPIHSPFDGDTVYVISTMGKQEEATPARLTQLGTLAADCVARAIARGVYEAESLAGYPSYRSRL
ncbi:MAG: P1 family peptidase [Pseudomonadota bacterium]